MGLINDARCLKKVGLLHRNTEKSTGAKDDLNKHYFSIDLKANKIDVKLAVETIFGKGKVAFVNIMRRKGQTIMFKGKRGRQSDCKIAIVTLKAEQTLCSIEG